MRYSGRSVGRRSKAPANADPVPPWRADIGKRGQVGAFLAHIERHDLPVRECGIERMEMFVEKLYRAEIWLAGAVIVLDLLLTASIYSPLASSLAPQNISASGTPGTVGLYLSVFVQTLRQQLFMD